MLTQFIQAMENAISALEKWPNQSIHLFHHNDADGLCSAAILSRAFERAGYGVRRVCLEKTYPPVLKKIFEQSGQILVFADFAGRIAPVLSDLNQERNLVLILDHHVAPACEDPTVYNLNPEHFGFKGDRDMSASTTCYILARTMDLSNRDLAHIAVVGAVGDGFLTDAFEYAARFDYAVAANLNVWASFLKANRVSKGYGWGYIRPEEEGDVTYQRLTAISDPAVGTAVPAIPDDDLGWEVNAGVDWMLLDGLQVNTRVSYWQPGKWFNYACISRANPGWAAPAAGNLYGTAPDRVIDPILGLEVAVGVGF